MSGAVHITADADLDQLQADLAKEAVAWLALVPRSEMAVRNYQLLFRAETALAALREERDTETRRFVEHLDAWRRNNAHHACVIERLQEQLGAGATS